MSLEEMTMTKLDGLYERQAQLGAEMNAILKAVTDTQVAAWLAKGGCDKCNGHERVMTWSTLDGPGWTEYGPCTACTPQSKLAGKRPASAWSGNGYRDSVAGFLSVEEIMDMPNYRSLGVLLNTYDFHLAMLKAEIAEENERLTVGRGKQVVVVRGRKVPKGTTGECFWVGEDRFGGLRIGFTDAAGTTHWTAKSNVEVVDTESAAAAAA
jgi:hypothetical protein